MKNLKRKNQKRTVKLTSHERSSLKRKIIFEKLTPRGLVRAYILLKADQNQIKPLSNSAIAKDLLCSKQTVINVKKNFSRLGIKCIEYEQLEKKRKIKEDFHKHVCALASGSPPEGFKRWTLNLIVIHIEKLTGRKVSMYLITSIMKKENISLSNKKRNPRKSIHADIVKLTPEEKEWLKNKITSGKLAERNLKRAYILLKTDRNQNNPLDDISIARDLSCNLLTITNTKEKYAILGIQCIENKKPIKKYDDEFRVKLVELASRSPPEGYKRWTAKLLHKHILTLTGGRTCSISQIRLMLKKH